MESRAGDKNYRLPNTVSNHDKNTSIFFDGVNKISTTKEAVECRL
jgi:hypothetical protein